MIVRDGEKTYRLSGRERDEFITSRCGDTIYYEVRDGVIRVCANNPHDDNNSYVELIPEFMVDGLSADF